MTVVVLGNRDAGDDAAGLLVGDRLRAAGVEVLETSDVGRLVEALTASPQAVVVDAAPGPGRPGTVHRVASAGALRAAPAHSSHGLGLREAIGLAAAFGRSPELTVYAIVGRDFRPGAPVSAEVRRAAARVAEEIRSCA